MKIVISSYTFLPEIGGVATNVSILAQAFHDLGHQVVVVTLTPDEGAEQFDYQVLRRPRLDTLMRLYRDAEILILSNLSLRLALPLLLIRRRFALRHHSESAFSLSKNPIHPDAVRRLVMARAEHFVTSAFIGRRGGLPRFTVTHPFPSLNHITAEVKLPVMDRRGLLFVGRIEREKGLIWLLDRWPSIRTQLNVDRLTIVGDGSLRSEMETRIARERIADVILAGPATRREAAYQYGASLYTIIPSLWEEPFGAVALEALAAGSIPIIADRGGLREAGGDFAHYYDPDQPESFAAALQEARLTAEDHRTNPAKREDWLRAVDQYLHKFDPQDVAETIISTMGRAVESNGARPHLAGRPPAE